MVGEAQERSGRPRQENEESSSGCVEFGEPPKHVGGDDL